MAWYADLSKETIFFSESRLFRPSTAFHAANMGVVSAAAASRGGGSNVVTNGVNDIVRICSMAVRRVEGAENPWTVVMIAIVMQQDSILLVRR